MGDLSELMASIAEKASSSRSSSASAEAGFQIVAGERRYQAASRSASRDPIVIREVDDNEIIEIALVENIQRKDLTPFEESEALHALAERCDYTHEDMARRLGSRGPRSPSPCRSTCPTRSKTFVGWPTFTPSHCYYR
jgi:ParB family chromosome partitioning protein